MIVYSLKLIQILSYIALHICPIVCLSICLDVCLSVTLSLCVYVFVCLDVCLCIGVKDNSRYDSLQFDINTDTILHGFGGYFYCQLYADISFSTSLSLAKQRALCLPCISLSVLQLWVDFDEIFHWCLEPKL